MSLRTGLKHPRKREGEEMGGSPFHSLLWQLLTLIRALIHNNRIMSAVSANILEVLPPKYL
jgi:hypothetical protein